MPTYTAPCGFTFNASEAQIETLDALSKSHAGGIAKVYGYVAGSGRVSPTIYNAQVITRFSVRNLYMRQIEALQGIPFDLVWPAIEKSDNPKLSGLDQDSAEVIFNTRKADLIASKQKSMAVWDGEESIDGDAHREAHARNYVEIAKGVKVNFITEMMGSIKQPVIATNGYPTLHSILLPVLELSREVIEPGEYKKVNSGAPVLISKLIEKLMNSRSTKLKQLSLSEGKFDRIVLDRVSYLPEDVANIDASILT